VSVKKLPVQLATLLTYFAQVLKPTQAGEKGSRKIMLGVFFHFCCDSFQGTWSHFPKRGGRQEE